MTRTVVEQITQAGVQRLRFSAAPGRYLTRAALAGAFIFVGALLSSLCATAWFYDTNLPLAKLLGALAFLCRSHPHLSCWVVSCSPAVS